MKNAGEEAHKNIILPKYEYDDRLKIFREVNKPPPTIYAELGYNPAHPVDQAAEKKHYRRFYDDELENIKEIFPKKPFHQCDIIRGQSRGLNKGWFSFFSTTKTDDSGMITNEKVVGKFKGKVNIENKDEKDAYKATKDSRMKIILSLLNDLHQRKFSRLMDFRLSDLESFENTLKFEHMLEDM
jgi:hypothetical protein